MERQVREITLNLMSNLNTSSKILGDGVAESSCPQFIYCLLKNI